MAKLEWDKTGERLFETGTKNGVLYVYDSSKASAAQVLILLALLGMVLLA
jgi:hypothetical protein